MRRCLFYLSAAVVALAFGSEEIFVNVEAQHVSHNYFRSLLWDVSESCEDANLHITPPVAQYLPRKEERTFEAGVDVGRLV